MHALTAIEKQAALRSKRNTTNNTTNTNTTNLDTEDGDLSVFQNWHNYLVAVQDTVCD